MVTKIYLRPQDNPEFGKINDGFNAFVAEYNGFMKQLQAFRVPALYSRKKMRELIAIGAALRDYESRWLEHKGKAVSFYKDPRYTFPLDTNREICFHHYQRLLLYRITSSADSATRLITAYNERYFEVRNQLNFNIAIVSFVLAILSLILSLFMSG